MQEMETLYEDNHLLVVVKPPGVPCQADDSGDPDMLSILKEELKNRHQKPGNVYLGLVHRLDRPTGGVMVFARTSKAASRLSDQMRQHTIKKRYLAVTKGTLQPARGSMMDHLLKNRDKNLVSICTQDTEGARYAELNYRVLQTRDNISLIEVDLITGRSHQVRVQCASRGHALLGDHRYNPDAEDVPLGLWAIELKLTHPTTKKVMRFRTSPPASPPWDSFSPSELDFK